MQLRVARLCLDCEEVFANAETCPICASPHHAFLSQWLPVDERRRRKGRKSDRARVAPSLLEVWGRRIAGWFSGDAMVEAPASDTMPRTRASDHVPNLDFEDKEKEPPARSTAPQVARTTER